MNPPEAARDPSARSPFAGCAILVAAVGVMLFLIGFSVLTLFRQFNEIAKFSAAKPAPVAITPLEGRQPELDALAARIGKFREALGAKDAAASLDLTAEDINLAIAAYEPFADLRGTFRVLGIADDSLRIAISFPLNGKPRLTRAGERGWLASDSRHLNGTLVARPVLNKKEILLRIDRIEVPGATVPQAFIDQMSPYRITERYLGDAVLGPAMARLTRVEISDGKLVLSRTPGEIPPDTITDAQVDSASGRLFTALGIAAAIFLAIVAVIILVGARAKARRAREP